MSQSVAKALRPEVDQKTADYIDAAIEAGVNEVLSEDRHLESHISSLRSRVNALEHAASQAQPSQETMTQIAGRTASGLISTLREELQVKSKETEDKAQSALSKALEAKDKAESSSQEQAQIEARILRHVDRIVGKDRIDSIRQDVDNLKSTSASEDDTKTRIHQLEQSLASLQARIDDLTHALESIQDFDRYALTKRKLIRLMREMGYSE